MKKVLITGISGFTGIHLEKYLVSKGFDVFGIALKNANKKNCFQCDITIEENIIDVLKIVKPDYIVHLAGISFVADKDSINVYKINTIGSINLLSALDKLNMKPSKIILSSSATVYGNQNLEVLDESLTPKPANHYFMSKLAMEELAKNYFNKLNIIITRPFNYTGIGQANEFLIPKIVKCFQEEKKVIELGNINVIREFNDVGFVCEVYEKLLNSSVKSEILNIASGRGIKLLDVIEMMNNIAGYKIKVEVNQAFVRPNEIKSLTGSNKKLFSLIGEVQQKEFKNTLLKMHKGVSDIA